MLLPFRKETALHMLALVLALAQQTTDPALFEPFPPTPFDRVFEQTLDEHDAVLAGHGRAGRVTYKAEFTGTLHVWTKVEGDVDLFVRVETPTGELVTEDDNSGGGKTPYVKLEVEPGRELVLVAALASDSANVDVDGKSMTASRVLLTLHAIAAPETPETIAIGRESKSKLAELKRLREANELDEARALVQSTIEGLSAPGAEDSEILFARAWLAGYESYVLGVFQPARRAWSHILRHCLRTRPDEHPDLQAARGSLALPLERLGDLQGARVLEEKVLEVRSRTLPDEHPDLQMARGNLANTIKALGDLQGARVLEEKVLEVRSRTLPDEHPDLQMARGSLALTIRALGDLRGARVFQEKVLDVYSRTLPDEHPDLQAARSNLAGTLLQMGDLQGARLLQEKALEIMSRTLSEEHPHLRATRAGLASTMKALGDLQGARVLQEKVLEVGSRTLPDEHPDLQAARGNLALTRKTLGDLQGARALQEKVLEVFSRTLPDEHPNLQAARRRLADTMNSLGELKGARVLDEKVLEVCTRTLPDEHPDVQTARSNLAATILSLGDFQGARALQEKALEVASRTLPDEHPSLQLARSNLAFSIYQLGDLQGARVLQEKVLEVRSRTLPDDHPDLQAARGNLALTIEALGDLAGARVLEEKVVDVCSRTLPDQHPDLQLARSNLAATIKSLGDRHGARVLQEKVLDVYSRALPDEHPHLQAARSNLALTLQELGDLQGARLLQEKALEIMSRTLSEEHPHLRATRAGLAATMKALGDLQGARALQQKVLEVASRTLPDEHPDLQVARLDLALTIHALGDLEGARMLQEWALEITSRTLPQEHANLQQARLNLASTIIAEHAGASGRDGDRTREREAGRGRCVELLSASCESQSRAAQILVREVAPREAEARCSTLAEGLSYPLSVAAGLGAFAASRELELPCFALSETTRAAALGSASVMRVAAGSSEYAKLREELVASSTALADLAAQGTSSDAFRKARERREALERELVALGKTLGGASVAALEFDAGALAASLGERDAIVAYRRFTRSRVTVPEATERASLAPPIETSEASLCAFVLRRASSDAGRDTTSPTARPLLTLVELGPIAPIEDVVRAWREAIGAGLERGMTLSADRNAAMQVRGEALRALVLDPLLGAIGNAERLVVVSDDVLQLVPFDALPMPTEGASAPQLSGDRWRIDTRRTCTELLATRPVPDGGTLVALGGASFNSAPVELSAEDVAAVEDAPRAEAPVASILRGSAWAPGFAPLTYTGLEAREIAALHDEVAGDDAHSVVLEKRKASRAALETLAPRARWLHVATHGWFASESIRSWSDPEPLDKHTGLGMRLSGEEQVKGMSPMLLCGLALAGANLPENAVGRAPGLVTAEELSALDLTHCELVVLSACDTNVGVRERRAGQGVASLQMALQMAGARSVITSLWKVPDEATKELMLDFYRRLWVEKKPKWQALKEAKRTLRDAKDERGDPKYTVRDWAAWVLTGEPD